jgi:hypothetical protein
MTMMFSSTFVEDLSDAMFELHATMVDVLAVVTSVGPWDRQQYSPFGTREFCLVFIMFFRQWLIRVSTLMITPSILVYKA